MSKIYVRGMIVKAVNDSTMELTIQHFTGEKTISILFESTSLGTWILKDPKQITELWGCTELIPGNPLHVKFEVVTFTSWEKGSPTFMIPVVNGDF